MNEPELRALVREVIARHVADAGSVRARAPGDTQAVVRHASHAMFPLTAGGDEGGPCLIEPAVACSHCGYCKSWGH